MESELPKNISKSRNFFRINVALILLTILSIFLSKNVVKTNNVILETLSGLPILIVFVLAPLGLFYTWRSLKMKEGYSSLRMKYFFIHAAFCILILFMISIIIKDISQLF